MPKSPVTFEVIESPGMYQCSIYGHNPVTLKCSGVPEGLQCAFSLLANLALSSLDRSIRRTC